MGAWIPRVEMRNLLAMQLRQHEPTQAEHRLRGDALEKTSVKGRVVTVSDYSAERPYSRNRTQQNTMTPTKPNQPNYSSEAEQPASAGCVQQACSASDIFAEIKAELARAMAKFPNWPTDALHAVGVVAEEMGELQKEVLQLAHEPHKSSKEWVRKEALQTAAMAIRFLMSLDRYEFTPGPQHPQQNIEQ